MLSVPTLFTVFTVNFLALGMVWFYVARSYPNLGAARYWTAASLTAAVGTIISMLRGTIDPIIPIIVGNGLLLLATSLSTMGMNRFYGKPTQALTQVVIIGIGLALMAVFTLWRDDMAMRVLIYSVAQSVSVGMTIGLTFSRKDGGGNAGARLAGAIAVGVIVVHALRSAAAVSQIGGGLTLTDFNALQAAMILLLVFLSMAWNFGFLLMAIDRLRGEVAELALVDDLTGVANRRQFLKRLQEECILALRTQKPFALLAIDLDGFKEINDGHGHAAGDDCLRHFTLLTQIRLRPGDLLARTGGDEFCVVLPATTLAEAGQIARRILDACRDDAKACTPDEIAISASIGVAEWTSQIGRDADRLTAAADHALYAAKRDGKNRSALFDSAPPLQPDIPIDAAVGVGALRKFA